MCSLCSSAVCSQIINVQANVNASVCSFFAAGDQCSLTCPAGYTASGPSTLTCAKGGGAVDAIDFSCLRSMLRRGTNISIMYQQLPIADSCRLSNVQPNVTATNCTLRLFGGESCTLRCPPGFTATGSPNLTCPLTGGVLDAIGFGCVSSMLAPLTPARGAFCGFRAMYYRTHSL